jgi:hypothetical protein
LARHVHEICIYNYVYLQIPTTSVTGRYKLRVEGSYDRLMGGLAFVNETYITFSQRSMTIFIQTDTPVYMLGETGMPTLVLQGQQFCTSAVMAVDV